MTVTGPQDNPDWVPLAQVVPGIVYPPTITALPTNAVHNLGTFYVGNLPALIADLRSFLNAQLVQVTFSFSNDSSFLTGTTTYTMLCDSTHACRAYIPVTGCFVQVSMQTLGAGAANLSAQLLVNGVGSGLRSSQFIGASDATAGTAAAVGAGLSTTQGMSITAPGTWQAACDSTQVGLLVRVEQQLANGAWSRVGQTRGGALQELILPCDLVAAPTRMSVFNLAAAAADLAFSLVPAS